MLLCLTAMGYDQDNPYAHEAGQAENKPGHKKLVNYKLPSWVRHPLQPEQKKVGILFPGEQNHSVGMLKDVRKKPAVRAMLEKATDVFGFDVEELMKDGPASAMKATGVNQPLMYVANCAAYEVMKERHPVEALKNQAVAGFSVGEYSALYAAGVITFEQGLEIVKVRATAMQELADNVEMEALVVRGVPQDRLERMMKNALKIDAEVGSEPQLHISRYWCPDGFVCAGAKSTVLKLAEVAEREAGKIAGAEVRLLPDHVHAGHTPMAKQAAEKVAEVLDEMVPMMYPPRCEIFLNQTGWRVPPGSSPYDFIDALKEQLSEPLLWESCITQMLRWGIRQFYEVGPSRSLRFMMSYYEHFIEVPVEIVKPAEFTSSITV